LDLGDLAQLHSGAIIESSDFRFVFSDNGTTWSVLESSDEGKTFNEFDTVGTAVTNHGRPKGICELKSKKIFVTGGITTESFLNDFYRMDLLTRVYGYE
jgi:hypothetical protein